MSVQSMPAVETPRTPQPSRRQLWRPAYLPYAALIVGALAVRWAVMPILFHGWDLPVLAWSSRFVALGDLNVYDSGLRGWVETGWNRPKLSSPVSHGPLFYYIYGAWMWFISLFGLFPLRQWTVADPAGIIAPQILLLKVPHLVADFAAGFFLAGIFSGWRRFAALTMWLFAPLAFYATYAAGQNDVYMVACVCAALYFAKQAMSSELRATPLRGQEAYEPEETISYPPLANDTLNHQSSIINRSSQSSISWHAYAALLALSVGAGFKLFPIFFVPFLALLLGWQSTLPLKANLWRVGRLLAAGLLPVGVLFGILAVTTRTFITSVLFSWEANLLGAVGIDSGGGFLSLFWFGYVALLAHALIRAVLQPQRPFRFPDVIVYLGGVIFWYSIVAVYPARFLAWMLPFLLIMVIERPKLYFPFFLINGAFLVSLINQHGDLATVWMARDREFFLIGTPENFLSAALPFGQIVTLATAVSVIALVYLWGRYSWQNGAGIFSHKSLVLSHQSENEDDHSNTIKNSVFSASSSVNSVVKIPVFWQFAPFLLVYGVLIILFWLSAGATGVRQVEQPQSDGVLARIEKQVTLEQEFLAPPGTLERITVQFATYGRYNLSNLEFRLLTADPERRELARTSINTLYVKNAEPYPFKLPRPVTLEQPTRLVFVLSSPDGGLETSLGVFGSQFSNRTARESTGMPNWADRGPDNRQGLISPARVNGQATEKIVAFEAVYAVDWSKRGQIFSDLIGRPAAFGWLYYLIGGALVLVCGAMVVAARRRKADLR
jgi:hypothetical protein